MANILLIEDDPVLGRGLHVNLELEGYEVRWASNLSSAADVHRKSKFDLIILDLGLPDGNGLDFLKKIRREGSQTPVMVLTAKTDEDSVVMGLQSGAMDYIRKPFSSRELLARIKSSLREVHHQGEKIRYGDLVLIPEERSVQWKGSPIELNRREFDVLRFFIQRAETVVTREELLQLLDKDGEIFDRTIDSHVSHVRSRLKLAGIKAIQISSVYGVGYRLEKK
jgi:DNA-binding response OmpR family regulator